MRMEELVVSMRKHSDNEVHHYAQAGSQAEKIAAQQVLRERREVQQAEKQKAADDLATARHTESIELTKTGVKHAKDAVYWAIVATIVSAIGVFFGVQVQLPPAIFKREVLPFSKTHRFVFALLHFQKGSPSDLKRELVPF